MSVDGDISYCSAEMDETGEKAQPLKFKEANSSLHLVEKQEAAVLSRIFIPRMTANMGDSTPENTPVTTNKHLDDMAVVLSMQVIKEEDEERAPASNASQGGSSHHDEVSKHV